MSWDEVFGIMRRAVERGLLRKQRTIVPYLGVDEKAFKKGHSYMTIVCNVQKGNVESVTEGRTKESLAEYWRSLSNEQMAGIKAVSMDMLPSYFSATVENIPNAKDKIVFDRFHIMKYVNKALDQVQRSEHRECIRQGSSILTGTKAMWRYSKENLPDRYQERFSTLKEAKLKTARAWAIKESLREMWKYNYPASAKKFFQQWFYWATHSQLKPIKTVAYMIKDRLENIVTYCKHRITNGVAEGINSKIMSVKRRACGYRNKDNFKMAIYFFCGDLELHP
jgi:transposase